MALKVKPKKKKKKRVCAPEFCYNCRYIGEGNFICDKYIDDPDRVLVVDEWEPTENFMQCYRRKQNESA